MDKLDFSSCKSIKEKIIGLYSRFNYFDTRQQAADSTSSTARRSNAVAKVKLICYTKNNASTLPTTHFENG